MRAIRIFQLLAMTLVLPLAAGAAEKEKSWTGMLSAVRGTRSVTVMDALQTKTFNIGRDCIVTVNSKAAALNDLRPGVQVVIRYQHADGALVADSIAEKVLRCTGSVRSIDSQGRVATLEPKSVVGLVAPGRIFRFDRNCEVTHRNGQSGTLEEVKPGDKITILYTLSNGAPMAYRVEDPG
jgi:hypothetical protein